MSSRTETEGLCIECLRGIKAFRNAFNSKFMQTSAIAYLEVYPEAQEAEGTKRCIKCQSIKPLTEFYHYKGRPHSYCRPCQSKYNADRQLRVSSRIGPAKGKRYNRARTAE